MLIDIFTQNPWKWKSGRSLNFFWLWVWKHFFKKIELHPSQAIWPFIGWDVSQWKVSKGEIFKCWTLDVLNFWGLSVSKPKRLCFKILAKDLKEYWIRNIRNNHLVNYAYVMAVHLRRAFELITTAVITSTHFQVIFSCDNNHIWQWQ